jgi:hypothetical protein
MVMPKLGVKNIIIDWPSEAREIAQGIIDKYGEPDEAMPSMLLWRNNGQWKRTIVYRDTVRHNFPFPHNDGVEQYIDHETPMEKACELAAFDGSVVLHCTRGEISVCCYDEEANFLALNLAHDIIRDRISFEQARRFYVNSMIAYRQHKTVPYMEKLQFPPEANTPEPDEVAISEAELFQESSFCKSE